MIHQSQGKEDCGYSEPEDTIEDIIGRYLTEQTSKEENTLKIEIVENHQSTQSEDEKISRYMTLVRLEVGRSSRSEQEEVIIKALRATRDSKRGGEKVPAWRKEKEMSE